MRLSTCGNCDQLVYFENTSCTRCKALLGFNPETLAMESFNPDGDGCLQAVAANSGSTYKYCANGTAHNACNWVVRADDEEPLCVACRLNRTIPDLSQGNNLVLWTKIESEKKRLIYSLLALQLPLAPEDPAAPQLAFDFLAEAEVSSAESEPVLTGHADGLITLNINEADSAQRESMREKMAESYRTLLGHFRHESGHYYWDLLVRNSEWLEPVRALFGDDTLDYAEALKSHYENGPAADWQSFYVSAYASTHPWEDWAETWAHYLHIVDTLETAHEFGIKIQPQVVERKGLQATIAIDPYDSKDFANIIKHWLPLTYALNSLNRSIGHEHAYPFILAEPVLQKLDLVHRIVQQNLKTSIEKNKVSNKPGNENNKLNNSGINKSGA